MLRQIESNLHAIRHQKMDQAALDQIRLSLYDMANGWLLTRVVDLVSKATETILATAWMWLFMGYYTI